MSLWQSLKRLFRRSELIDGLMTVVVDLMGGFIRDGVKNSIGVLLASRKNCSEIARKRTIQGLSGLGFQFVTRVPGTGFWFQGAEGSGPNLADFLYLMTRKKRELHS